MEAISTGGVISRVMRIYRDHAAVLLGTALILFGIDALASFVLTDSLLVLAAILSLVLGTFYQGMVVELVRDVQDGRRDSSVGALFRSVSPAVVPLIAVSFLAALGVGIGFLLLIVPGLFLLTIWAVVAPVTVLERPGVLAAFGRSRELVRGHGWPVFGVMVIVLLLIIAVATVSVLIGAATGDAGEAITGWLLSALAQPISALAASVLYFALLGRRDAPGDEVERPSGSYGGFSPPVPDR
ncbi:MAG: hypothetical protein H0V26_01380 [Solirubrobacterales bacterium]|nr:hypothetical protein [Solirubrobacterales bacterium]